MQITAMQSTAVQRLTDCLRDCKYATVESRDVLHILLSSTVATYKRTVAWISANNSHSLFFIFFMNCKPVAKGSNHAKQNYLQKIVTCSRLS